MAQSNALTTTTTGSSAPSVIPPTAPTASVKTKAPTKGPVQPQKKPTTVDNGRRAYRNQVVVENVDRQAFRGIESFLSSLGQAVGLGNIWRFPTTAYKNGGLSFLIAYVVCGILFAVPAIHMEFALGQYAAKSPPAAFRRMMPILEGVGWMTCLVGAIIGVYYMIVISWIVLYLFNIIYATKISKCNNDWNKNRSTICYEGVKQKLCSGYMLNSSLVMTNLTRNASVHSKMMYIDGKCQNATNMKLAVGTEQFFTNFVVKPSTGFTDFNSINVPMLAAVAVCWVIAIISLIRGMKAIGKLSYYTVLLPYAIIIALMIRGLTLEGASTGLHFLFWGKPNEYGHYDFAGLYDPDVWIAALMQMCFSLSIGQGGLMNIGSYNKKTYNWYRDAYLVVLCDTLMSLLGGTAVFSTLGFLAEQRNISISNPKGFNEVVQEGHALAFIVYTEAIAQMPYPFLWYALFFVMLFLLGISTEIVIIETVCSCLADRFHYLRQHRWITVVTVSTTFFLLGLVMTSDAGFYWFDLYDEYSAGVSATIGTAIMCLTVCWCYGLDNFRADIREMWEEPESRLDKYLGPGAYVWTIVWRFVTPICCLVIMFAWIWDKKYPFKGDSKKYPPVFDAFGWFVAALPFFVVPVFAGFAIKRFKDLNIPIRGVFMVQKQHPAYDRISEKWPEWKQKIGDKLPELEPGEDDLEDGLEGSDDDLFYEY
ncbi:Transporter [Caenorhabditis elegans]|uniref:Transporter n=1 Tax=Caenorhabditis elegans TaxID=6239 RepID=G5EE39_CAEEL|nr:Transporter [Caenorhabditis elegans]CAB04975.2 Transporter [Caenorhabditis elegans]|eukprot:NP_499702.2 Transporter [Caenorhabditis elegans]